MRKQPDRLKILGCEYPALGLPSDREVATALALQETALALQEAAGVARSDLL
jgi:hypothetical protein